MTHDDHDGGVWLFRCQPDHHSRYEMGVLDGDTYDLLVDQGFRTQQQVRVRSMTVDTDEIFAPDTDDEHERAIEQRDFARRWMRDRLNDEVDWPLLVSTRKETGKYGRWLGEVYDHAGGSLGNALVDEFGEHLRSDQ